MYLLIRSRTIRRAVLCVSLCYGMFYLKSHGSETHPNNMVVLLVFVPIQLLLIHAQEVPSGADMV